MKRAEAVKDIEMARKRLSRGELIVYYLLTPSEAYADRRVRKSIEDFDPRSFASARLAEKAGFDVEVEIQEWKGHEDLYHGWRVTIPPEVARELLAMAWDYPEGGLQYTLTRSTRHPGWQLTIFTVEGFPWAHREIYEDASEAFDTRPMASGVSLGGLVQIMFRDGRVLVREGAQKIAFNPSPPTRNLSALKRNLMA